MCLQSPGGRVARCRSYSHHTAINTFPQSATPSINFARRVIHECDTGRPDCNNIYIGGRDVKQEVMRDHTLDEWC
jgi:hypothetical protein